MRSYATRTRTTTDPLCRWTRDEPPGLFAPPPTHRHSRPTERAAAERIAPAASSLRQKVRDWIAEVGQGGATVRELAARLATERGLPPGDAGCRLAIAPRLTELAHAGAIIDAGAVRERCTAWRVAEGGAP